MNKRGIMPGNYGGDCLYNGSCTDEHGTPIECRCDECDFLMCCYSDSGQCDACTQEECPRKSG